MESKSHSNCCRVWMDNESESRNRNESGFTLVELLIGIQVGFVFLSMAYLGYILFGQLVQRWNDKIAVETHVALVSNVLTRNADHLDRIMHYEHNNLVASSTNGDTTSLSVDDLFRINGSVVGDSTFRIQDGELQFVQSDKPGRSILTFRGKWLFAEKEVPFQYSARLTRLRLEN